MNTRLIRSSGPLAGLAAASGCAGCTNFSPGMDSPVIADWATKRSRAPSRRQSAGIMSPADKVTMSPDTRSHNGMSCGLAGHVLSALAVVPLLRRITVAVLLTIARRLSAARCERPS